MRGFVGCMGPILAILIFNIGYDNVLNIFLIGILIGAISYLLFTVYLIASLKGKKKYIVLKLTERGLIIFLDLFYIFLIINTPFLINFGNIYFEFQSSFFLQLYPLINSLSSIYLLYFYDRAMSSIIDLEKIDKNIISDYLIQGYFLVYCLNSLIDMSNLTFINQIIISYYSFMILVAYLHPRYLPYEKVLYPILLLFLFFSNADKA